MDSPRQVVRWSLPGSVLLMLLGLFELIHIALYGDYGLLATIERINPVVVAGVIVAGIPIGFLIDQLYYATYGRIVLFRHVTYDRGAAVLRDLPTEARQRLQRRAGIADLEVDEMEEAGWFGLPRLRSPRDGGIDKKTYQARHRQHRTLMQFAVMTLEDGTEAFKAEYTSLSDIYNSLGSTRISVVLAFVLFVLLHAQHTRQRPALSIAVVATYGIVVAIFGMLLWAVEMARRGTNDTLQQFLTFALQKYPRGMPASSLQAER